MMESPKINTDSAFPSFEWSEGSRPDDLHINEAGFFEDNTGSWYMVRKAKEALALDDVLPTDLFNGDRETLKNSTEGRGLYFTNTVRSAERVLFVGDKVKLPNELFIGRIAVAPEEVLDAHAPLAGKTRAHQAASLLLRARAVVPGIPNPGRRGWDALYGDARLVTTKPLAMARALSGSATSRINDKRIAQRWAIVRDLDAIDIVGKRSA